MNKRYAPQRDNDTADYAYEPQDSGPGLGTLAAVLSAAALATPVGRPVRKMIGKADSALGGFGAKGKTKFVDPLVDKASAYMKDGALARAWKEGEAGIASKDAEIALGRSPSQFRETPSNVMATGRGFKNFGQSLWKSAKEGLGPKIPIIPTAETVVAKAVVPTKTIPITELTPTVVKKEGLWGPQNQGVKNYQHEFDFRSPIDEAAIAPGLTSARRGVQNLGPVAGPGDILKDIAAMPIAEQTRRINHITKGLPEAQRASEREALLYALDNLDQPISQTIGRDKSLIQPFIDKLAKQPNASQEWINAHLHFLDKTAGKQKRAETLLARILNPTP